MIRYTNNTNNFFIIFKELYNMYIFFFYNLSLNSTFNIFNNSLLKSLNYIIFYKKTNSTFKKKINYFNFFKFIRPLMLSSYKGSINFKLFNPRINLIKKTSTLFTKRPFNKKHLKKRLISIRLLYRNNILYTRSNNKLTSYIIKNKHYSSIEWYKRYIFNINNIIRSFFFIQSKRDSQELCKAGLVFVNRNNYITTSKILKLYDILEIVIIRSLLVYNLYNYNTIKKNVFKLRYKIKLYKSNKEKINDKHTKISKNVEHLNILWFLVQKKFFEYNYFSFSLFMIYKFIKYSQYDYFYIRLVSFYLMRLYNWGYYL